MSGGGGAPTSSTVVQSNLPEYAQPYFESLMNSGMVETARPYVSYPGQRTSGFTDTQQGAMNDINNMQMPDTYALARTAGVGALGTAMNNMQGASNYAPGQFEYAGYQSWLDNNNPQKYMNPYMQDVVDFQKSAAVRDYGVQQKDRDTAAMKAGAFGGYRQGIENAEATRNLNSQLQGIQANGLNSAWEQGQKQFNTDTGNYLNTVNSRLNAQQQAEQSRQYAGNLGLQAGNQGISAMGGLASLAGNELQGNLNLANAKFTAGNAEQELRQKAMDTAYSDFVNQRDYNRNQLQYYAGLLRGVPTTANTDTTQIQAAPSMLGQAANLGIAGLGLYNATKG